MLAGDFTALGLGRVQRRPARSALRAPFVNNRIAPSQLNPVALNYARYLPASTDPCGRVQFGIPNDSTEHQALGRVDYTLNQRAQPVCPLPVRPLREPGDLRRPERAHAEPHRPDQRRQLGRHGPQVAAHQQPGQRVDRHLQQDAERPPAARVLHRHRPRQQHRQPVSRLFRRQRHRQRVHRRRRRHQPRLLRLDRLPDRRRRRSGARQPPDLGRRQLDPHQDRDLQQPPDQRPVHLQRPVHRPGDGRLHGRLGERRLPAGQPGLRLPGSRLHRRLPAGRLASAAEPDPERRAALGAVHPAAQHLFLGQPLRPGPLRSEPAQHRLSPGAAGADLPRRRRLSRPRLQPQEVEHVRAAARCDLDPDRRRVAERPRLVGHLLRHAAPVLQHPLHQQPAVGRADHHRQLRPAASPIPTSATPAATRSRRSTTTGRRRPSRPSAST